MNSELTEKRNELQAKQQKLAQIFEDIKTSEGKRDVMKTDKLHGETAKARQEEIAKMNAELDDIGQEVERLAAMDAAESKTNGGMKHAQPQPEREREFKTFGDMLVESQAYKNKGSKAEFNVGLKTLMDTSAGWAPESLRTGRVVESAERPIQIIDLLPSGTTSQNSVVYMEETTFTNNAAATEEAGTYGESALAFTEQSAGVKKIAVYIPVTDEQLDDVAQVRSYVNNRLRFQLRQTLEDQIMNGDGSGANMTGLLNVSGLLTQEKGSDDIPTAIYKAMTDVRVTGRAMPGVVIMHPNDWQSVRLSVDSNGQYLWGPPSTSGPERIWGIPVTTSTVMPEGTAVTGDFNNFIELVERQSVEVQISNSHSDFFINGKQAIRADMRAALPIYRPAAFAEITGLDA